MNNLNSKHNISYVELNTNEDKVKEDLDFFGLKVKSMGRNYEEDKEFFQSASIAAYYLNDK